jgi:hypothetical protein
MLHALPFTTFGEIAPLGLAQVAPELDWLETAN